MMNNNITQLPVQATTGFDVTGNFQTLPYQQPYLESTTCRYITLPCQVQLSKVENGFLVLWKNKEYVFANVDELNTFIKENLDG